MHRSAYAASIASLAFALSAAGCADGGGSSSGDSGGPASASQVPASTETVILLEPGLEGEVGPLVAAHEAMGRQVTIVPLDQVNAPGRDRAEELRTWLVEHYRAGGPRDLLLIGSPEAIPYRTCTVAPGHTAVSDLYYADLTGEWDRDGDGLYGELDDDAPDFTAELRVGRIPYGAPADVRAAVSAIEAARPQGEPWRDELLLVAGNIVKTGDGAQGAETLRTIYFDPQGWQVTRAYSPSSDLQGDVPLTSDTVVTELQQQPRGAVFFVAHGSPTALTSAEPSGSMAVFFATQMAQLPRDRPPVLVAASCDAGDPGDGLRLGEDALASGAAGFVGATTVIDPTSGGGAGFGAVMDVAQRLAEGQPLGVVLWETIDTYHTLGMANVSTPEERAEVQREALSGILYGDPALTVGPRAR